MLHMPSADRPSLLEPTPEFCRCSLLVTLSDYSLAVRSNSVFRMANNKRETRCDILELNWLECVAQSREKMLHSEAAVPTNRQGRDHPYKSIEFWLL